MLKKFQSKNIMGMTKLLCGQVIDVVHARFQPKNCRFWLNIKYIDFIAADRGVPATMLYKTSLLYFKLRFGSLRFHEKNSSVLNPNTPQNKTYSYGTRKVWRMYFQKISRFKAWEYTKSAARAVCNCAKMHSALFEYNTNLWLDSLKASVLTIVWPAATTIEGRVVRF